MIQPIVKTVIIGVSYKDMDKSQHFFAEVVLLDKTQEALNPLLYQLKKEAICGNDDLASIPKEFVNIQQDAFMMVGEVVGFDKKKKFITLSNGNTVSYNYLIVAANPQSSYTEVELNREFSDGLQSLIDALRVKKVPTPFGAMVGQGETIKATKASFDPIARVALQEIQSLVNHRILKEANNPICLALNGNDKRLYEVVV